MKRPPPTDAAALKRLYAKSSVQPNGCVLWGKAVRTDGYGQFAVTPTWVMGAHRAALAYHLGRWPAAGVLVLHSCDTPLCINPAHLREGTNADNARDRNRKRRQARGARHGRAKLTAAQVFQIRILLAQGKHAEAVAAHFNVSRRTINRIGNKQLWR